MNGGFHDDVPDVDTADLFLAWNRGREDNVVTHREAFLTSKCAGKRETAPGSPWLQAEHAVEYMGDAGELMGMMSFHQKLGGLSLTRNV